MSETPFPRNSILKFSRGEIPQTYRQGTTFKATTHYLTYLTVTTCFGRPSSVWRTKTICRGLGMSQLITKCHESHVSRIGAILILDDLAPSLNTAGHNKKSFSFRQADVT